MDKSTYNFEDFISTLNPESKDFVIKINDILQKESYKIKIEDKVSGLFVSYSHPKTKRSILNFQNRKKGLLVRIYADYYHKYTDFLNRIPENMEKEIAKSPVCKRLVNPNDCNTKCIRGYDFFIRGNNYKKCRYCCFQFAVNQESIPVLVEFLENEVTERKKPAQ